MMACTDPEPGPTMLPRFTTLPVLALALAVIPAGAVDRPVSDVPGLVAAIGMAEPGDTITLASGSYRLTGSITVARPGTIGAPIVLRAATPRGATVQVDTVIGLRLDAPDWRVQDLVFEGVCALDSDCEHAVQILSDADRLVLRGNVLRDFNAPVKGNGEPSGAGGTYVFSDDVLIEDNVLYATRPRDTANPVTFIDVVGGRRWVVRGNLIQDFRKLLGNEISYGAFLKGNSRDGVFERNLVICERAFTGGVRIGLSFGGGGTGATFCEDGDCTTEHQNGILRNNLIANCSDVGIYLNRASNTQVSHNTLYATSGIDVRFATSSANVRNNAYMGALRNRDGGTSTAAGNLGGVSAATMQGWFVAPGDGDFRAAAIAGLVDAGVAGTGVLDDWCGDDRDADPPDSGAIEYDGEADCATRRDPPGAPLFADGFE
jgi:parallel beta-helix repeat protein